MMSLAFILLQGFVVALVAAADPPIDCNRQAAAFCANQCLPICAGNDTYQETFTNTCLYFTEYCNRKLNNDNFRKLELDKACDIDCNKTFKCSATYYDPICVRSKDGKYVKTFKNDCLFHTEYCNNLKQRIGTQYCIDKKQECSY